MLRTNFKKFIFDATSAPCLPPRVIAVTGGKGGVGKTVCTANVGIALAQAGWRVLMIDADFGLANLDVVLGVQPRHTLEDVIDGQIELSEVLIQVKPSLWLLPAASGYLRIGEMTTFQQLSLLEKINKHQMDFDIVLIDTPAGVSKNVKYWAGSASDVICVSTPEPTSIADCYATMKILSESSYENQFKLLVNMVGSESEGLKVYDRLSQTAAEHLCIKIEYLGSVCDDDTVKLAIRNRTPCILQYPFAKATHNFRAIASELQQQQSRESPKGTIQFFLKNFLPSTLLENSI